METSQSENATDNSQPLGRKDPVMATPSIEERLRRLEDAHSVHGPGHVNSPLVCNASLLHKQQISDLGKGFNQLEEAIYALEQANNDREERVRKLEQQIHASERMEVDGKNDSKLADRAAELINAKTDTALSTLLVDLEVQKASLNNIAIRLCQLEKQSAPSLSTFTTHDIAQALVQRLGNGDDLELVVQLQLRATLGARDSSLPTLAPTSTTRGDSTIGAATFDGPQTKAAPSSPPKRSMGEPPDDEPLLKRQRGHVSKTSSTDSLSIKSEPKCSRGRPRKYGSDTRKYSIASVVLSASGEAPPATMLAPRSLPARSPVKKKGTATKLTKTMLAKRSADEQPTPEVGKHWRDRVISGSTNSDASMEHSEVITPKRTIQLMGVTSAATGDAKSDKPIAVATKTQRTATSQTKGLTPGCKQATGSRTSTSPRPAIVTPKRNTLTSLLKESTPLSQNLVLGFDSESPLKTKARSSPGYRDMNTPDLAAMEESTADGLSIPPERRSSRKPKAAKHFGDMVSWKEANAQVGALRPSAP